MSDVRAVVKRTPRTLLPSLPGLTLTHVRSGADFCRWINRICEADSKLVISMFQERRSGGGRDDREGGVEPHGQPGHRGGQDRAALSHLQVFFQDSLCPICRYSVKTRVVTLSQIQFRTNSENTIFVLFWIDNPSK